MKVFGGTRRLASDDSTVKVEWQILAAKAMDSSSINTATLQNNIETEARIVANVAIVVSEVSRSEITTSFI